MKLPREWIAILVEKKSVNVMFDSGKPDKIVN